MDTLALLKYGNFHKSLLRPLLKYIYILSDLYLDLLLLVRMNVSKPHDKVFISSHDHIQSQRTTQFNNVVDITTLMN